MNTYNEKEIIALLQDPARQKEAFECIVNEYSEQLYWQIRRMVLSHEDANDLLQNTFIKAWTNLEYFRAEAKISTWLYRIALNECLTFLNKQRATNQLSIDDADADMVNKLESDTYFNGDETQILFQKALQFVDSQRYVVSDLGITVVIIEHYRTLFYLITGQIKFGIKRFDLPSFFTSILQSVTLQTRSMNKSIIP